MHIAILTFDGFNEIDVFVAYGMLSRLSLMGDDNWRVSIASPTARVTSMNGLTVDVHCDLEGVQTADAVLVTSGMKTRDVSLDADLMARIKLDPQRQLIAAQCSGTYLLAKLGVLGKLPACTDLSSKPWVQAAGVNVVNKAFASSGNIATAGGCFASQYLAAWIISKNKGISKAQEILHYFAPVGEKQTYVERALAHLQA